MATLLIPPRYQFVDADGEVLIGGKLYTYVAGTTTPKTTWKDQAKVAANTNPIILDSQGTASIWLDGSYKINLTDSDDVQIAGYPVDKINGYDPVDWTGLTASIAALNGCSGNVINKTAIYNVAAGDWGKTITCDATTGAFNINLLAATTATDGFQIIIKKTDASVNAITIDGSGAETVDDRTTFLLSDYNDFVHLVCNGSNWKIRSAQLRGTTKVITAVETLTISDINKTLLCDSSSGTFALTLPTAASVGAGYGVTIKKTDATINSVTVTAQGAETIDGSTTEEITEQYYSSTYLTDGSNWHVISDHGSELSEPLPTSYVTGLTIENDTDADHDIKINTGKCRDVGDSLNIVFASSMVKRIDATWAAGTGNGGRPTTVALSNDTWYHFFVIAKPDGTVDAGFDTAIDASGLLGDATDFTKYRRIGSVLTDGSANIMPTITYNINGQRYVIWKTGDATLAYGATNPGTNAVLATIRTPLGIKTISILSSRVTDSGAGNTMYISDPDIDDVIPDAGLGFIIGDPSKTQDGQIFCGTNLSSQIRYRLTGSNAGTDIVINAIGWLENI